MRGLKKLVLGMVGLLSAGMVFAAEAPVLNYDYTSGSLKSTGTYAAPKVTGSPVVAKDKFGALSLDGAKTMLTVPGGEKFTLVNGGSLFAFVRYDAKRDYGMVFFKNGEFLMGVAKGRAMYFNIIRNGKSWNTSTTVPSFPQGKWCAMAVTVNVDKAGKTCEIKMYLDGALKQVKKVAFDSLLSKNAPLTIGKGWGGVWYLKADLGAAALYDRPLSAAEVKALSDKYMKLVK